MAETQQKGETTSPRPDQKKDSDKKFATATRYVIITEDNIKKEVQRGDHLAYTMSLGGKLLEIASNSCLILL